MSEEDERKRHRRNKGNKKKKKNKQKQSVYIALDEPRNCKMCQQRQQSQEEDDDPVMSGALLLREDSGLQEASSWRDTTKNEPSRKYSATTSFEQDLSGIVRRRSSALSSAESPLQTASSRKDFSSGTSLGKGKARVGDPGCSQKNGIVDMIPETKSVKFNFPNYETEDSKDSDQDSAAENEYNFTKSYRDNPDEDSDDSNLDEPLNVVQLPSSPPQFYLPGSQAIEYLLVHDLLRSLRSFHVLSHHSFLVWKNPNVHSIRLLRLDGLPLYIFRTN